MQKSGPHIFRNQSLDSFHLRIMQEIQFYYHFGEVFLFHCQEKVILICLEYYFDRLNTIYEYIRCTTDVSILIIEIDAHLSGHTSAQ